ncbi:fumarylacetoacetate hydrolase family protein [Rhizobiaceae bacterium]|nr:fumarylacetoacetate hydrolase family protein [Rhizobiaceae bacterium]
MRLATISKNGDERLVSLLDGERMLDLAAADSAESGVSDPSFASMLAFIAAGEAPMERARALIEDPHNDAVLLAKDVRFLAPISQPPQIRDCLVFEEHLKNSFAQAEKMTGRPFAIPDVWYEQPIYYKANRFSVIGHEQNVEWPSFSQHMDFECELAVVVGQSGKNIPVDRAADHIFGYTIFNDMTARDAQMREMAGQLGPAKGKDFDTGNVLGPCIVTADEIEMDADGRISLDMEARVNGKRWGGGNASAMHHTFGAILAHISASETLHTGEIIGSGTVGTGCGLELGKQLSDGDVIELEIERIGTLRNRIVKG